MSLNAITRSVLGPWLVICLNPCCFSHKSCFNSGIGDSKEHCRYGWPTGW